MRLPGLSMGRRGRWRLVGGERLDISKPKCRLHRLLREIFVGPRLLSQLVSFVSFGSVGLPLWTDYARGFFDVKHLFLRSNHDTACHSGHAISRLKDLRYV